MSLNKLNNENGCGAPTTTKHREVAKYRVYCHCGSHAVGHMSDDALAAVFDCDECGRQFMTMNGPGLMEAHE